MQRSVRISPFFLILILSLSSCSREPELRPVRQTQLKLGTFVTISIYDTGRPDRDKRRALSGAFALIDSLDRIASAQRDSSELNLVSLRAGQGKVKASPLLFHILRLGDQVARETGGAFDPTIGAVSQLWGFSTDHPHLPDSSDIRKALSLVDYHAVQLDSPWVKLERRGMRLDLGGIAKGTAIDLVMKRLLQLGFRDIMIDAGGDLGIHSSETTRGKIRVWIRHPRKAEGTFANFYADSGAVATSGDYEQYFEVGGLRYCHILNPKTGYPDSDLASVTVVSRSAEVADAYATGIFVLGWKRGIEFAKHHPELGIILVQVKEKKLRYWVSENMKNRLKVVDDKI